MSTQREQGLADFQRALREYLRYNQRELGPVLENRGRRVQFGLYRAFRAIAPTKEALQAELDALGGRVRRREGEDGKPVTLRQEIMIRRRSLKWLSVSFLIRSWKRSEEGRSATLPALSRRRTEVGRAILRTAKGESRPRVRILSFLDGATVQDAKRGIVDQVLQGEVADMRTYIARKQAEEFQRRLGRVFEETIAP